METAIQNTGCIVISNAIVGKKQSLSEFGLFLFFNYLAGSLTNSLSLSITPRREKTEDGKSRDNAEPFAVRKRGTAGCAFQERLIIATRASGLRYATLRAVTSAGAPSLRSAAA